MQKHDGGRVGRSCLAVEQLPALHARVTMMDGHHGQTPRRNAALSFSTMSERGASSRADTPLIRGGYELVDKK
ncbi:hypothetical protein ACFOY2_32820 [Nonomuraea purpurea]|uniref:DUF397 domain-containing protein n=1 Tax=Nonomuraea purpurea TaxID=1849276 RepID=A0ABV8GI63_9ACTN